MYNFNIIENFDKIYKGKHYIKERELSILEFNTRVLELAEDVSVPILERLKFINIVFKNIDEFISIKLSECKTDEKSHYINYIQKMYHIMDELLFDIISTSSLQISSSINVCKDNDNFFTDGGVYYVYIEKNGKFNIVPFESSIEETEEKIKYLSPMLEIQYSFLIRCISDKSFKYIYSGENTDEILEEIQCLINIKNGSVFNYIQTTCKNPMIMEKFLSEMGLIVDGYIYISELLIQLPVLINRIESVNTRPELRYPEFNANYTKYDYFNELCKKDIIIRTPYDNYKHITDFIDQMCSSSEIIAIFITLYRTSSASVIVDSLINAKKLGKSVYVYIEPIARGDEEHNLSLIEKLTSYNINVSCNYFNYKVHAKMFCALSNNGTIYTHIGTGNYNEDTSKIYTDIHLLTTEPILSHQTLELMQSIFKKTLYYKPSDENRLLFNSPINLREEIIKCIEKEIKKGENGRIYIKCNSLCDLQVIDKLYNADKAGVDVKLIIRTACSILPTKNIKIRSKIGRFLEHDRIYIFGNDIFISSADLLLRNINKRVEILCKIIDKTARLKIIDTFFSVWNDDIHFIGQDFKWYLLKKK